MCSTVNEKPSMKICGKDIHIEGRLVRIARLDADTYEFLESPEEAVKALKSANRKIDLFTLTQRLADASPKYPYFMELDNLAVVPVKTFDEWWAHQIGPKTRNQARLAEKKGVALREVPFDEDLVRGIWEIYNESPVRQGKAFAHYGKDIPTVRTEVGTFLDRSIFIGAFVDRKLIGFAKLLCDETRTQAGLVHILSMLLHRDKAPTNALIAHAVRACAARGIPYLVYSRFTDGRKQWDSLMHFKERNGFRQIDLPRYYIPLSPIGSIALRLGLHRRFADRVPEALLVPLRKVRTLWANRRSRVVKESL